MKLVDKRGNKVHIPDKDVPDQMREWLYSSVQMMPDNAKLDPCWVATLCASNWQKRDTYEYVAEEIYDHKPTEEELLWLMAKNDAFRFSYVTVDKGYHLHEEYD